MPKMRCHQPIQLHPPLTDQAFLSAGGGGGRFACVHLHPRLAWLIPEALVAGGALAVPCSVGHELLDHDGGGVGRESREVVGDDGLVGRREEGLGMVETVGVLWGGDVGVVEG